MKAMGPVQRLLAERLAGLTGIDWHEGLETVPRSSLGELRVDLRTAYPRVAARALKEAGRHVAAELARDPAVEVTTMVPPRVYVRLTTEALWEVVLSGVEREGDLYGRLPLGARPPVLLTFSDPNANKPLHVGHLRNLFLGSALAVLHEVRGHPVRREGTFGDWGVHICAALVAYLGAGGTDSPERSESKPDHFVGAFYSRYHQTHADEDFAAARHLLTELERGDGPRELHDRLTTWARAGIQQTYERVGVTFDALYPESDYLASARQVVADGLSRGGLTVRSDGCVVVPGDEHTDDMVVVRADGTLLVYPQILGIDRVRFASWPHHIVSIFGHQWEAGVVDLLALARAAGMSWVDRYEPIFYGMVRLPTGSMRSREGRTVTADDAIAAAVEAVETLDGNADSERVAIGALKYHLLRQARTKAALFDTDELVQKTLPTFRGLLDAADFSSAPSSAQWPTEGPETATASVRRLLVILDSFPDTLEGALERRNPAIVLRYVEELNTGLEELREDEHRYGRLLAGAGAVIRNGLLAVGIDVPQAQEARGKALV
jgi:arginyl-tRNA synthetase